MKKLVSHILSVGVICLCAGMGTQAQSVTYEPLKQETGWNTDDKNSAQIDTSAGTIASSVAWDWPWGAYTFESPLVLNQVGSKIEFTFEISNTPNNLNMIALVSFIEKEHDALVIGWGEAGTATNRTLGVGIAKQGETNNQNDVIGENWNFFEFKSDNTIRQDGVVFESPFSNTIHAATISGSLTCIAEGEWLFSMQVNDSAAQTITFSQATDNNIDFDHIDSMSISIKGPAAKQPTIGNLQIIYSLQQVPEPATSTTLLLGGLALCARRSRYL